jgi:hypothetical protein
VPVYAFDAAGAGALDEVGVAAGFFVAVGLGAGLEIDGLVLDPVLVTASELELPEPAAGVGSGAAATGFAGFAFLTLGAAVAPATTSVPEVSSTAGSLTPSAVLGASTPAAERSASMGRGT